MENTGDEGSNAGGHCFYVESQPASRFERYLSMRESRRLCFAFWGWEGWRKGPEVGSQRCEQEGGGRCSINQHESGGQQ